MHNVLSCNNKEELNDLLVVLDIHYKDLHHLSKVGHFNKKVKRALLDVLGFISALLVSIPLGIVSMVACAIFLDPHNFSTIRQLPNYFFTGMLVGVGIVLQYFSSFENSQDRQLNFSLKELKSSFDSLTDDVTHDDLSTKKREVLIELAGEDEDAQQQFLKSMQTYDLMGFEAQFLSTHLKGYQGHHTALVYTKKGEQTTIELGSPSLVEIRDPDQTYQRQCSGETLVNMIALDLLLKKQYAKFSRTISYRPYDKDCHSYIDVILAAANEPLSPVERATKDDSWVGQKICNTLRKHGIYKDKPTVPASSKSKDNEDEMNRNPKHKI